MPQAGLKCVLVHGKGEESSRAGGSELVRLLCVLRAQTCGVDNTCREILLPPESHPLLEAHVYWLCEKVSVGSILRTVVLVLIIFDLS